jgi:tetratricopeptide (TPR) repeat protein
LKSPQQSIAHALEATGQPDAAIAAYKRLLVLEPDNPADVKFRLAKLLRGKDDAAAKRHLIDALVLAPRFRDAHRLLMEMQQ